MYVHVCVCFYMLLLDITKGYELYVCACVCVCVYMLLLVITKGYELYACACVCVCLYVIVGHY